MTFPVFFYLAHLVRPESLMPSFDSDSDDDDDDDSVDGGAKVDEDVLAGAGWYTRDVRNVTNSSVQKHVMIVIA